MLYDVQVKCMIQHSINCLLVYNEIFAATCIPFFVLAARRIIFWFYFQIQQTSWLFGWHIHLTTCLGSFYFAHILFSFSVQFSHLVMSDSLWPHGLQHARLPCPSSIPRVCSNSCPLSQWCHPTISSSVVPFCSRLQSFPASESFQMSQFFESGGQSIGVSASASVLPMNTQDWSPLGGTGWILQSKGLWRVFSNTTVQKHPFFSAQLSL